MPTAVVLHWLPPLGIATATDYLVQDSSGEIARLVDGDRRQLLVEGLEPDTPYRFTVTARTSEGWTAAAPFAWVRTAKDPSTAQGSDFTGVELGRADATRATEDAAAFCNRFGIAIDRTGRHANDQAGRLFLWGGPCDFTGSTGLPNHIAETHPEAR